MDYQSRAQAKKLTGLSYYGMVNNSTKHEKAYKYQEMVYTLYLSPAKSSGYEVCPGRTTECTAYCLNQSGRNKMVSDHNRIPASRTKKTRLLFEDREFTVRWIIDEITAAKAKADRDGYYFSVRLNNTSDISPEDFYITINGIKFNLLEIFPDIQFYDYTKVFSRYELLEKYSNYDLTFSYTGYNIDKCKTVLNQNGRVAVVFRSKIQPETFMGRKVINGDLYDLRYRDPKNVIVGLYFKTVRTKLTDNNIFVIG